MVITLNGSGVSFEIFGHPKQPQSSKTPVNAPKPSTVPLYHCCTPTTALALHYRIVVLLLYCSTELYCADTIPLQILLTSAVRHTTSPLPLQYRDTPRPHPTQEHISFHSARPRTHHPHAALKSLSPSTASCSHARRGATFYVFQEPLKANGNNNTSLTSMQILC